jgi:ELWxxDGT repeat protein
MFQICILLALTVGLLALLLRLLGEAATANGSHGRRFRPCIEGLEERIAPSSVQSFDINFGFPDSNPEQYVDGGNGFAYFIATSNNNKQFLCTALNGGNVGRVYDLTTAGASEPENLFYFRGALYFTATSATLGRELWVCGTDGSVPAAPRVFADIDPGPDGSFPINYLADSANSKFYFTAATGAPGTRNIWVCDTTAGTIQKLNGAGGVDVDPGTMSLISGSLYFCGDDGTGNGSEPFQFKLATNQLISMGNLSPLALSSAAANFTQYGNKILFSGINWDANFLAIGFKIYSWDPQQQQLTTVVSNAAVREFVLVTLNGTQCVAYTTPSGGASLTLGIWDGTNAPAPIIGSAGALSPTELTATDSGLYFLGTTSAGLGRLCRLTGTAQSDLQENVNGGAANPSGLLYANSALWFVSDRIGVQGNRVLTKIVAGGAPQQILNGSDSLQNAAPVAIGNTLYFREESYVTKRELSPNPPPLYSWPQKYLGIELGTFTDEPAPKIKGKSWFDVDYDGIQQASETKLADIGVTLFDSAGEPIVYTYTVADGSYTFNYLADGVYKVQFAPPDGHAFTKQYVGIDPQVDSDANEVYDMGDTSAFTINSGTSMTALDAGIFETTAVTGRVWNDADTDGIQDEGESDFSGVIVDLLDAQGGLVDSTITDSDGRYFFTGIPPGTYSLRIVRPDGYALTAMDQGSNDSLDSDFTIATAATPQFEIVEGQLSVEFDAGLRVATASVSGRAWVDADQDGIQDVSESGHAGMVVRLVDAVTLVTIAITTTDPNGNYSFDDVPAGSYYIEFVPPQGYIFTTQDAGSDDSIDSDVDPTTHKTSVFTLDPFEDLLNMDAGLININPQ